MGKEQPSSVFPVMTNPPCHQPVLEGTRDTPNTNTSPKKTSPSQLDKARKKNEKLLEMQVKLMKEKTKWKEKYKLLGDILAEMKHTESCLMETCKHIMKTDDLSTDLDNDIILALPAGNIHGQTDNRLSETQHNTRLNNVKQETRLNLRNNSLVKNEVRDNSVDDVYFKTNFKYDADDAYLSDVQLLGTSPDARGDHDFSDTSDDYNKMPLPESSENCFDSRFFSPYQLEQYGDLPFTENDTLNKNFKEHENYISAEDRLPSEVSFENLFENDVLCNQHEECCQSPQKANNGGSKQANKRTYSSFETLTQGHRIRCVKRKQACIINHKPEANTAGFESVAATEKDMNMKSKNSTDVDTATDEASVPRPVKESSLVHTETGKEKGTKLGKGKEVKNNAAKKDQTLEDTLENERHSNDSNVEKNPGMPRNIKEGIDSAETTKAITIVDPGKVDSCKEKIATAGTAQADSSKQEITADVGRADSVNEEITASGTTRVDGLNENITIVGTAEVEGTKENITTDNTAKVDSSKQVITTAETYKFDSFKKEITTAETDKFDSSKQKITAAEKGGIDSAKQEITAAEIAKVDSSKQEITTAETAKADSSKQEITTAEIAKVDSSKQEITTAEKDDIDSSKQEITAAEIAKVDSFKHEITTAEIDKVDSSKQEITTAEIAKVDSSKQEITTAEIAKVDSSKQEITTAEIAKVDSSKQEITTAEIAKVVSSKQEITTAEKGDIDSSKQEITTAEIAKVDSSKQEITAAEIAKLDSSKQEIITSDTGRVDSCKEEITAPDTTQVDVSSKGKTTADTAKSDISTEGIRTTDTAKSDISTEGIRTTDTVKADISTEGIRTTDTAKADISIEWIRTTDTAKADISIERIRRTHTAKADISIERIHRTHIAKMDSSNNTALNGTHLQQAGGVSSEQALSYVVFSIALEEENEQLEDEAIVVRINKTYQTMTGNKEEKEASTEHFNYNAEE